MEPVGDTVLVIGEETFKKDDEGLNVSDGGIVIPKGEAKKHKNRNQLAVFVSCGPLAFLEEIKEAEYWKIKPVIPREGDLLSIASYSGYNLKDPDDEDIEYQVILPRDIQVIVKRKEDG